MRSSIIQVGVVVLVVIAAVGGTAILVSDTPLRRLCRTDCWLNDLLFGMFGELRGKQMLALLWYVAAVLLAILALRIRKSRSSTRRDR